MSDRQPDRREPRIAYLVRRFHTMAYAAIEEVTRDHDLSPAEYTMLSIVLGAGPCSAADVARRTSITPQAVTQQINQLESKGFLARRANEANRRINLLELTDKGADAIAIIDQRADAIEAEWLKKFDARERATIRAFLNQALD